MSVLGQGLSGIRVETPESMVLDVGILYANIDESALQGSGGSATATALAAGVKLGATRKGAKFNDGKKVRHVDIDGKRFPIKGLERPEEFMPTLEVELLEVTHANLKRMLGSVVEDAHTHHTEYLLNVDITDTDYIDNIAIVSTHTSGDEPFIIVLRNCLQTDASGLNLEDKNEMGVACKFVAHALASAPNDSPVSMYVPSAAPAS